MNFSAHVVLVLPHVGALRVATDLENQTTWSVPNGLDNLRTSLWKSAEDFSPHVQKAMASYANQFLKGVSQVWKNVSAEKRVSLIPVEELGLENSYTDTLEEEMARYGSGTLIKLQVLQQDHGLKTNLNEWAISFEGGAQCAELMHEMKEQCSRPYKESLVVVVGKELDNLKRLDDDAHYFEMKMTSDFRKRTFIVHGNTEHRASALLPLTQASGGTLAHAQPVDEEKVARYVPDVWFSEGRVEIRPFLHTAPENQLNKSGNVKLWPRLMAAKFLWEAEHMIKRGLLASDWTPVASYGGAYVTLLPTATFVQMSDLSDDSTIEKLDAAALKEEKHTFSESFRALRETISNVFGQQTDLKKIVEKFSDSDTDENSGSHLNSNANSGSDSTQREKLALIAQLGNMKQGALTLIQDLRGKTADWDTLEY